MQRASVTRIVDGDTFHALVDGVEETVRIFGVDTPERGEPCFSEATDELRLLVATTGGQVLLVTDVRKRDRYDRLLRYVYAPDGLSIDAVLIARGFAHAWTDDGALRDPLVAVEAQARGQRTGCLWR
jgi:micrococcal nuclease